MNLQLALVALPDRYGFKHAQCLKLSTVLYRTKNPHLSTEWIAIVIYTLLCVFDCTLWTWLQGWPCRSVLHPDFFVCPWNVSTANGQINKFSAYSSLRMTGLVTPWFASCKLFVQEYCMSNNIDHYNDVTLLKSKFYKKIDVYIAKLITLIELNASQWQHLTSAD